MDRSRPDFAACIRLELSQVPALLKELESGDVFELGDFCVIGRNEDVAIRLSHPGISRQHASIRREGRNYWLVDLGSANGTFVNDVALTSARALRHGDRLQLGALVLTFQQSEVDTRPDFSANAKTQISRLAPAPDAERTGHTVRGRPERLHADERRALRRAGGRSAERMVCRLQRHPQRPWRIDRQIHRRLRLRLLARHRAGDSRKGAAVGRGVARRRNRSDVAGRALRSGRSAE